MPSKILGVKQLLAALLMSCLACNASAIMAFACQTDSDHDNVGYGSVYYVPNLPNCLADDTLIGSCPAECTIPPENDNCPFAVNIDQADTDGDGVGDVCDPDSDGNLDPSFGTGGKVTTAIGSGAEQINALIQQSDGRLVAAGYSYNGANNDFALVRYNSDGTLDTGFGTGGKVTTAIGSGVEQINALIQQSDGRLVAAGYSSNGANYDFALARYNSDGTLDATFGVDGKVTTAIGSGAEYINALVKQNDGKLVVAGYSYNGTNHDFVLARYNTDGTLDVTFGTNGITIAAAGSNNLAYALTQQTDGKFAVAGMATTTNNDVALIRYNADGSLDTGFGTNGKVTTAVSSLSGGAAADEARAIVQQGDGKLVVAGFACMATSFGCSQNDFVLIRYNTNGSLDTTFGTNGKTIVSASTNNFLGAAPDQAYALILQPDGKLVAAGTTWGTTVDFELMRFNANGVLDTGFGTGGMVSTAIGTSTDTSYALIRQSDGKLVAAGYSNNGTNNDFALVRYLSALPTDTDGDGIDDLSDNCSTVSNANQLNTDGDAQGDVCDTDDDNDTVLDVSDNCPLITNLDQMNTDGDAQGNVCDTDDDNDTVLDVSDNCQTTSNSNQLNTDGDTQGNVCDTDDDNDGVQDAQDCYPLDNTKSACTSVTQSIPKCSGNDSYYGPYSKNEVRTCSVSGNILTCSVTAQSTGHPSALMTYCSGTQYNVTPVTTTKILGNAIPTDISWTTGCGYTNPGTGISVTTNVGSLCWNWLPPSISMWWFATELDGDQLQDAADNCPSISNPDQLNTDGDTQGNVCDTDDDNDLMSDIWETTYGLNPLLNDAAGDFDGDGISNLQEYLNGSNPTMKPVENDFADDGKADLLLRNSTTGDWSLAQLNGLTVLNQNTVSAFSDIENVIISTADFNGDGTADILTRGNDNGFLPGTFHIDLTNGAVVTGSAWLFTMSIDLNDEVMSTKDFNKDGKADVLLRNKTTGVWKINYMNGISDPTTGALNASTDLCYTLKGDGDYDGNGYPDLLLRKDNCGGASYPWLVYTTDGDTTILASGVPTGVSMNTTWAAVVTDKDFNGDGKSDVLLRAMSGSVQQWLLYDMNGAGAPSASGLLNIAVQSMWQFASEADLNGDGKADIMLRSIDNGQWYGYLLDNTTILTPGVVNMAINPVWTLQGINDNNGDGKGDTLLRNSASGSWYLYLMNGLTVQANSALLITSDLNYVLQND